MSKWLACIASILLLLILGTVVLAEPEGEFHNAAVYVNGRFYTGAPLFRTNEGDWFVPLKEISAYAGLEEPILEDGFIDWQGFWMDAESADFFFEKDTLYAISAILEDAGLVIQQGILWEEPVLWISEPGELEGDWAERTTLIAHAMGAIEGAAYTNSLEAFQENYANGFSVFEVDFQMSADDVPIAVHEWPQFAEYVGVDSETFSIPTHAEFKAMRILGEYTTLDFEDVVQLMVDHPDIRIITDMKEGTPENAQKMFTAFRDIAYGTDASVLDRLVPQVYSNDMLDTILQIYPWKSIVYTMYQLPYNTTRTQAFWYGYTRGVRVFTAPSGAVGSEIETLTRLSGSKLYLHTVNDWDYYRVMKSEGHMWGVYTDSLTPLAMDGVESWTD